MMQLNLRGAPLAPLAIAISFLLLSGASAARAQSAVASELRSMSEGSQNAFTIEVEGADEKLAYAEWRDLMKEYGGRAKRSKPERARVDEVVITSVGGAEPLAVYVDFSERGSQTKTYLWVKHRGEFLGEGAAERDLAAVGDLMSEYGVRLRRAVVQRELDEENRELEKVERKLKNLERDYAGYERDIERAKAAIERAEAAIERAEENIVKNTAAQEETRDELEQQADDVKAVRSKLEAVGT